MIIIMVAIISVFGIVAQIIIQIDMKIKIEVSFEN